MSDIKRSCFFILLHGILISGKVIFVNNIGDKSAEVKSEPCPCNDQPEGIVMPHPSDCRAYYTCLGTTNVRYNRCGGEDQFFHPYLRNCAERSKYLSFIPNIVETKDLCKVSSVFQAPTAENFDNCHIMSDELAREDSNSAEDTVRDINIFLPSNSEQVNYSWGTTNGTTTTTLKPDFSNISSSAVSKMLAGLLDKPRVTDAGSFTLKVSTTSTPPPNTTTTTPAPTPEPPIVTDCKLSKLTVHHFPGPCRAEIVCESGDTFTVNNCLNTLTFISQIMPGSST